MNVPLHILMTADPVGGVWTYALELSRALGPHGVTLTLTTMGALPNASQRRELAELPHVTLHTSPYALEWMNDPWPDVHAAGRWLQELSASVQPDVIHLNGYTHASLEWSAPVVTVAHSCVLSWWRAVKGEAAPASYAEYYERVRRGLSAADVVVAPSNAMLDLLREHYDFRGEGRVIANARSSKIFRPRGKQPLVFSAGRIWDEAKNIALLEKIAPRLHWPVHIAGPASPSSTAEAGSLGRSHPARNVVELGRLAAPVLADHLAIASIYAAPARYEPFGLAILEAALSGCALVLSDIPSLRENWDGAALFVPPDDETAWVETLNILSADPRRRALLSGRALERSRQFTPAAMAMQYLELYREFIARRAAAPEVAAFA